MKKRYWYTLMFAVPGFFIAVIVAITIAGMAAGFLWLFVFGDEAWDPAAGVALPVVSLFAFAAAWFGLIATGFVLGRRLEADPSVNKKHIALAVGFTFVPIALIYFQQLGVGNIGPKSDSVLCSEYCVTKGFSGSGMPPRDSGDRTCSCFNETGDAVIKLPVDRLRHRQ